jgi:hypothetical protein
MRLLIAVPLTIVLCAIPATPERQAHPIPPGVREADKQPSKPLEAPVEAKPRTADPAKLKQEADELAQLSASVPADIGFVAHGQLPKDLADRLKRIEKLAKHLRSEISQ